MNRVFRLLAALTAAVLLLTCVPAMAVSIEFTVFDDELPELYPDNGDPAKAERYEKALSELNSGNVLDAVNDFAGIGKYRDAPRYTSYAQAKLLYLRQNPQKAQAAFEELGSFYDSAFQAKLCAAMGVHRFAENGLFGYMDLDGNTVIEPAYDWAERVFRDESRPSGDDRDALLPVAAVFSGTTAVLDGDLVPETGHYGLLRRDGVLIVPMEYDEILWTKSGLAAVRKGSRATLINLSSGEALRDSYNRIAEPSEGFCAVCSGGKWGYLKLSTGTLIGKGCVWDEAQRFSEGLAGVTSGKKAGFINTDGSVVIELQYQAVKPFGEGLAAFRLNKKWGFINAKGEVVLKNIYGDASSFAYGACAVKKNKYGAIDKDGNVLIEFRYDEVTDPDPVYHRMWMRTNKLWGIANAEGEIFVTPAFAGYTPLGNEGVSRVNYRGAYGYADASGNLRIQMEYPAASAFSGERGGVLSDAEAGIVTYLNRNNMGFDVESNVPTELLCGFIEGRLVDAEGNLSFRLYNGKGTAVTEWSR